MALITVVRGLRVLFAASDRKGGQMLEDAEQYPIGSVSEPHERSRKTIKD